MQDESLNKNSELNPNDTSTNDLGQKTKENTENIPFSRQGMVVEPIHADLKPSYPEIIKPRPQAAKQNEAKIEVQPDSHKKYNDKLIIGLISLILFAIFSGISFLSYSFYSSSQKTEMNSLIDKIIDKSNN